MSAQFTINGDALDSLCVLSADLTLSTGGRDELTLTFATQQEAAPYAYRDAISVHLGTEKIFSGRVLKPALEQSAGGDSWEVLVGGAGADLDAIILEQSIKSSDGSELTAVNIPRVWLGQAPDGTHEASGAVIGRVLDWAISRGAAVTKGTLITGRETVQTEVVDTSCGDAIRQYLRLEPEAVSWVDGDGAYHLRDRADLSLVTLTPEDDLADAVVSVSEASEMAPVGVKIVWERTHTDDGTPRVERIVQSAGAATGWPPPIAMTIELAGSETTYEKETLRTRTLPDAEALDSTVSVQFFKGLLPFLADVDNADLAIENYHIEIVPNRFEDEWDADESEVTNPNAKPVGSPPSIGSFPRQLLSGVIQPWMDYESAPAKVSAKVYYKGTDKAVIRAIGGSRKYSKSANAWYWEYELKDVPIEVTDGTPTEHRTVASYSGGESPIEGLAAAYFSAISDAPYLGQISGVACGKIATLRPGTRVQITGQMDRPAIVQQTRYDLLDATVSATLGLPDHLQPQDTVEMARAMNANRPKWVTPEQRTEAAESTTTGGGIGGVREVQTQALSGPQNSQGPWSLNYDDETEKITVNVGTITDDFDEVTITDATESFAPGDLDCLYLEADGSGLDFIEDNLASVTLKCGQWTDFPDMFDIDDTGSLPVIDFARFALWQFHTSPPDDPTAIAIGDLYARQIIPSAHLRVDNDIAYITDSLRELSVIDLKPGRGLVQSS